MEKPPNIESLDDIRIKRTQVCIGDYTDPEYQLVSDIVSIDGKLAYRAETLDGRQIVNFDGQEMFDKTLQDLIKESQGI